MNYKLVVSDEAEHKANRIYQWLAERSPEGANRWYAAFRAVLHDIERNPRGFGLAPEDELVPEELRQALFKTRKGRTYRAVFMLFGEEVSVVHVRGPGQPLLEADEFGHELP